MTQPPSAPQAEALNYFHLAYSYQMQGELDKAIQLYRKSIQTFPTAEAHTFLGWSYSFQERYEEAIRECFKAIGIDPDYGNPYNDIGSYLLLLDQIDEAIPWFEKALAAPRYEARVFPYFNLGRVYEMRFQFRDALRCYQQALKEDPAYLPAYRAWVKLQALHN
jgi:tetratricopeptide (TPR) repeat protein